MRSSTLICVEYTCAADADYLVEAGFQYCHSCRPSFNSSETLIFRLGLQGETAEEVAGLAKAMRARCIHVPTAGDVLDIVGTGGDGIGSVNISTGATVIAAAAGAKVAKHGNRSVSSLCGSADVLEVSNLPFLFPHGLL